MNGYSAGTQASYAMPCSSSSTIDAARVEALTAPNRPAVAMPSSRFTPGSRAKIAEPASTTPTPITTENTAGRTISARFASRISIPPFIPIFIKSTNTMNW